MLIKQRKAGLVLVGGDLLKVMISWRRGCLELMIRLVVRLECDGKKEPIK
jgi:hypothetical protein